MPLDQSFSPGAPGESYYTSMIGLLALISRGVVTRNLTSTAAKRLVDSKYLSDPQDAETLVPTSETVVVHLLATPAILA